jgi:thiamine biosynthesis lipoprotein
VGLRHVEHCMGTVFSLDLRGDGVSDHALGEAVALLHRIDRTYSTYLPDSEISRLARGELHPELAGEQVRQVLAECQRWTDLTDGWFSCYPDGTLDPSGYVKGWAIRQASELLVRAGSSAHCINGGGDVQCHGSAGPDRPWRAGITDPHDRSRLLATVSGVDLAVATSGTAERGRHIFDPHTRQPAGDGIASVSVVGTDVLECDVLATAAFAMGERAPGWLAGRPGITAYLVWADGSTWSSPAAT